MYGALRRTSSPLVYSSQRGQSALLGRRAAIITPHLPRINNECRRSLSHDPRNPAYVDRIRVIAMYQMKNRHDPKSYLKCLHIIREEILEQERTNFAAVSWGALAKMDNALMRDASSKKPVWTGEEREAVNVVIREFRLMLVLFKWAMTSAAIGFGTIVWKLCQWDSGR